MAAFSIPASLGPGSRLGHYEIIAPLRAGGMANLFLGKRVGPGGFARPVAIKVVHAHLASDPAFVDMFLDEARLAARIQHPNVVHTEELGEEKGTYYLAMEYVHGCSLSQFLIRLLQQKRGLAIDVAVHIAMKVADGLHAAHEVKDENGEPLGVVHRDVSPQNVLLAYDGHVKLIDFGVAKAAGRMRETVGASLKGKIRYMAPEQAWGRPIDRRTDVYALGIVLWEALTHRRLFHDEDDFAALEAVRSPHVVGPSTWVPAVNEALDHAVMTALAPDPAGRFDTAQAFRRALGNACPRAAQVEPDDLGALLTSVMQEDIERERRSAPPAVTRALAVKKADLARKNDAMMHYTRELPAYVEPAEERPTRAERPERVDASERVREPVDAEDEESRVRLSDVSGMPRPPKSSTLVLVLTTLGVLALFASTFGVYWYEREASEGAARTEPAAAPPISAPAAPPPSSISPVAPPTTTSTSTTTHARPRHPAHAPDPTTTRASPSTPPPWIAPATSPASSVVAPSLVPPPTSAPPASAAREPEPPPPVDFDAPLHPPPTTTTAPAPTTLAPTRLTLPPASVAPLTRTPSSVPLRTAPR